jgi:integrase
MHPVLAGFLMAWRERTPYAKDGDYVFPSFRLKGKKPLSASIMVQKYLRPAAIKAGVIKEDGRVRFGFHNFRHSLASSLVKLKCDPKTVQGILRHEDVRTTCNCMLSPTRNRDSKHRANSWHYCSETTVTC